MVEANLVKYFINSFMLGSGFGPDRDSSSMPAKAVYVPSEQLFVRKNPNSDMIGGPVHKMYEVLNGDASQKAYDELLGQLKETTPENIEVPDSFVTWAKALHEASNPPAEISEILSPL